MDKMQYFNIFYAFMIVVLAAMSKQVLELSFLEHGVELVDLDAIVHSNRLLIRCHVST